MSLIPHVFPEEMEFLRILWCDNANIIRAKAIYLQEGEDFPLKVGIGAGQQGVPVMYDGIIEESGLSPIGEIQLEADLSTFKELDYAPGHVQVMGYMIKDGKIWSCCPRGFLKKMIINLKKINLEVKSSFENEFYLLKNDSEQNKGPEILEETPFASTYSMNINHEFIRELVDSINNQGMRVEQYYPEAGPGQQEVTIKYDDALVSADNQISFRDTVKAVAHLHGIQSSFLPKIFSQKSGNGCHIHLSLWKNDENKTGNVDNEYGLSSQCKQFIAGILKHLPAIMAITTPTSNSYRRIKPKTWSGAFQCWGIDNREAAIRVISEEDGAVKHVEIKTVDASSNPYLALGVIIAAGMDGLKNSLELEKPLQEDPGNMTPSDLAKRKIKLLPNNLGDAICHLENDKIILDALGKDLSKAYLAVKKAEWEFFRDLSLSEEVEILLDKF
jgi:glutamine synthetase